MPTVFSANSSSITIDSEPIEGLQSLTFRVVTEREDIRAVGSDERIDVSFGLRIVIGELMVRSSSSKLDELLENRVSFGLVASLSQADRISAPGETTLTETVYSFDECFVEHKSFNIAASGTGSTTYTFTATRVSRQ